MEGDGGEGIILLTLELFVGMSDVLPAVIWREGWGKEGRIERFVQESSYQLTGCGGCESAAMRGCFEGMEYCCEGVCC